MFYKQIEEKRHEWLNSTACTVKEVVSYIERKGKMRDAQIEAIKTFLYLKLHCRNKPLWELFCSGEFNHEQTLKTARAVADSYAVMQRTPAAVALLEYSRLYNKSGKMLSNDLEQEILEHASEIDFTKAFQDLFYGIGYPDYLYSLPMGAGKTYLMAAFIYLDLSFAIREPQNPLFAHNFMILAPSGKKTSIMPSLKNIMEFDPTWVLPEAVADEVRRIVRFEVLDEASTARGSNIVRNPNAQKISHHLSGDGDELMGLVAFTNAEKVILDRIDKAAADPGLFTDNEELRKEYDRIKQANELRTMIGQIPQMAIFIDEVHHVASEENKLRGVVTGWARKGSFKYMLGFSGTPYLDSAEPVKIGQVTVKNTDLPNVVYHYPLLWAVGNFLKRPDIKLADGTSEDIIRNGLNEFLSQYGSTTYANGTCAKVAIYCTSIEQLEEEVYPQATAICAEHGLNASEAILKFHGGNKTYRMPADAARDFAMLDTPQSRKRVVLLVKIGQEGWDCKSLTSVILSQKGACPTNLVLQTSCRCLREVIHTDGETEERALIWLNEWNYSKLNSEFNKTQNTSIDELVKANGRNQTTVQRYSRMERLEVPEISFFQMGIKRTTEYEESEARTAELLTPANIIATRKHIEITQKALGDKTIDKYEEEAVCDEYTTFNQWLYLTAKEGFNMTPVSLLLRHEGLLTDIFSRITVERDGVRYYRDDIDQQQVRSNVRLAFVPKKTYFQEKEIIPKTARMLAIEKEVFEQPKPVGSLRKYYPDQADVEDIHYFDSLTPKELEEEHRTAERMKARGREVLDPMTDFTERDYSYHYLPYKFDSPLERRFFTEYAIHLKELKDRGLEIYFNGDDELTEFKIACYKQVGKDQWEELGGYVPDFLILQRDGEGRLHKVLIVETKGEGYELNFAEKRQFMVGQFIEDNKAQLGYQNFSFLYLPEKEEQDYSRKLRERITEFFNE